MDVGSLLALTVAENEEVTKPNIRIRKEILQIDQIPLIRSDSQDAR